MSASEFEESPQAQQRPPTGAFAHLFAQPTPRFDTGSSVPPMPFPGMSFDPRSVRPAAFDPSIQPSRLPSFPGFGTVPSHPLPFPFGSVNPMFGPSSSPSSTGGFGANLNAPPPTSLPLFSPPTGSPLDTLQPLAPERRVVKVPKEGTEKKERKKTPKTLEKEAAYQVVQDAYWANSGTSTYEPAESGKKQVEGRRDATGQRVAQLLKLISERVREIGGGDEFESLWVDGTLIVAANDKAAIERVVQSIASTSDLLDEKLVWRLLAAPRVWQYTPERHHHTQKKLTKVALDERGSRWTDDRDGQDFASYQEMEDLLGAQLPNVTLLDEKGALKELNTPQAQRTRVIFFHGTAIHAEQQLVRLLAKSTLSALPAMVRGTKRPCYGCYVALRWAHESGACPGLNYTMKPGLFWISAAESAIQSVFEKHTGEKPRSYIDDMFKNFANCETWRSKVGDKDEADIDALSESSEDETEESRLPQAVRTGLAVPLRKPAPKKRKRTTSGDSEASGGRTTTKAPRKKAEETASAVATRTDEPTVTTRRPPPQRRPRRAQPPKARTAVRDDPGLADDEAEPDRMDIAPSVSTFLPQ